MFENHNEDIFDSILKTAFNQYIDDQFQKEPSEKELKTKYPITKKGQRRAKWLAKKAEYGKSPAIVYLQKACIIVLICICSFSAILSASPSVRASVRDTVIQWYEKYLLIDFGADNIPKETESESESETDAETVIVTYDMLQIYYVPDNFALISADELEGSRDYIYTSDDGRYFAVNISQTGLTNNAVDTEYAEFSQLTVNGNKAYLLYDYENNSGTIVMGNDQYTVSITAITTKDDLIKIAENIK